MEFLNDPSLVLYSSSYTPLLSVLSYLIHQQTTTSIYADDNFSYHSQLWISLLISDDEVLVVKWQMFSIITGNITLMTMLDQKTNSDLPATRQEAKYSENNYHGCL